MADKRRWIGIRDLELEVTALDNGLILIEKWIHSGLPPGTWKRWQIGLLVKFGFITKDWACKVLRLHSRVGRLNGG